MEPEDILVIIGIIVIATIPVGMLLLVYVTESSFCNSHNMEYDNNHHCISEHSNDKVDIYEIINVGPLKYKLGRVEAIEDSS